MERKIGLSSALALAKASSPHGYQSTGLWACWSKYGLFWWIRRLVKGCDPSFSSFMACWLGLTSKGRHPAKTRSNPKATEERTFLFTGTTYRLKKRLYRRFKNLLFPIPHVFLGDSAAPVDDERGRNSPNASISLGHLSIAQSQRIVDSLALRKGLHRHRPLRV